MKDIVTYINEESNNTFEINYKNLSINIEEFYFSPKGHSGVDILKNGEFPDDYEYYVDNSTLELKLSVTDGDDNGYISITITSDNSGVDISVDDIQNDLNLKPKTWYDIIEQSFKKFGNDLGGIEDELLKILKKEC